MRLGHPFHRVAAGFESGRHVARNRRFELQRAFRREMARRFRRLLRVATAIEYLRQEMRMPRRLVLPAHHAEGHLRAAVLRQHRRDDGVHWPLAARDRVGMTFGRTEAQTATMQHDRSEEHTSELQSLMRISYAVFCLKKKTKSKQQK